MDQRKAKKFGLSIIAAGCLAAATVHYLAQPAPTGPAEGVGAEGVASVTTTSATLRLGAFNIHGGKGVDGQRDLERTAACLKSLDFVALNEVRGPRYWEDENQAERLGERLDRQWLFAPSSRVWGRFECGNGLLTRVPLGHWQRIPLVRRHDRTYRNVVLVEIPHAGQTVRAIVAHVNRNNDAERQTQLREVAALFLALQEPAVLLGDLNSTHDEPQIRELLSVLGVCDAVAPHLAETVPEAARTGRIDWILTRGLRSLDGGMVDNGASDHPLIWAEVAVMPAEALLSGKLADETP